MHNNIEDDKRLRSHYRLGSTPNLESFMQAKERLLDEIDEIPESLIEEVLNFVQFLKAKHLQNSREISVMSESALAKDCLRPEEDEAWDRTILSQSFDQQ